MKTMKRPLRFFIQMIAIRKWCIAYRTTPYPNIFWPLISVANLFLLICPSLELQFLFSECRLVCQPIYLCACWYTYCIYIIHMSAFKMIVKKTLCSFFCFFLPLRFFRSNRSTNKVDRFNGTAYLHIYTVKRILCINTSAAMLSQYRIFHLVWCGAMWFDICIYFTWSNLYLNFHKMLYQFLK